MKHPRSGQSTGQSLLSVAAMAAALAASAGLTTQVRAEVKLYPVFQSGMVLQQEAPVQFGGSARPGEVITLTASFPLRPNKDGDSAALTATAGLDGRWVLHTALPRTDGTPQTLTFKGDNTIVLSDVLLGEVWLASGQSNMEWALAGIGGGRPMGPGAAMLTTAEQEIARPLPRNLRLLNVPRVIALDPVKELPAKWQPATNENIRGFSGVGLMFGRELAERLNVPVGIVESAWGGTRIETWMSPKRLAASGLEGPISELAGIDRFTGTVGEDRLRRELGEWWRDIDTVSAAKNPQIRAGAGGWDQPEFTDAGWRDMNVPGTVEGDLASMDGLFYFRREVSIPESWAGKPVTINLGPIDDRDDVRFNGRIVGRTYRGGQSAAPRRYRVPGELVTAGRAVLAVRVLDTGGAAGMAGGPEQYSLTLDGTSESIPLAGTFKLAPGAKLADLPPVPTSPLDNPNTIAALGKGMLAPLDGLGMRGAIWYQGESNVGRAAAYEKLQQLFIEDLIEMSGNPNLAFYPVAIAPFRYNGSDQAAFLREAQLAGLKPRIGSASTGGRGLVSTLDLGDHTDIHPDNKQEVARRLVLQAMAKTYGRSEISADGPRPVEFRFDAAACTIVLESTGGAISLDDGGRGMFELAGEDRVFWPAIATAVTAVPSGPGQRQTLTVRSSKVPRPVAVRYAFMASPYATLRDASGMTALSFRSDAWDNATHGQSERTGYLSDEQGLNPINPADWVAITGKGVAGSGEVLALDGKSSTVLRSKAAHQDYIFEFEWTIPREDGVASVILDASELPSTGSPMPSGIRLRLGAGRGNPVMLVEGELSGVGGAKVTAIDGYAKGDRILASERRTLPGGSGRGVPQWNHCRVERTGGNDGLITVAVNGKVVTRARSGVAGGGFVAIATGSSEGGPVQFRNIRIKGTGPRAEAGFRSLYNGQDLTGWKATAAHQGHFKPTDFRIVFDGKGEDLWSSESFGNFELVTDWRWTGKGEPMERPVILPDGNQATDGAGKPKVQTVTDAGDSGIYLRGSSKSQINMWCWPIGSGEVYGYRTDGAMSASVRAGVTPKAVADAPIGQWNRFVIRMTGTKLSVTLNGVTVLTDADLPGVAASGPIALQKHDGAVEFANIFVRPIK